MTWTRGQAIVRREVLKTGPWLGTIVFVVEDSPDWLVTYWPEGAPFGFPEGDWPTPDGRHPWHGRCAWEGHGTLMLQRPGERYAVWHFWDGPERAFAGWYLNLQEPFRRTSIGYDTQDLELDIWVFPDGSWQVKDLELLPQRVAEGRWTEAEVAAIRAEGDRLVTRLERGGRWWDAHWSTWSPDPAWNPPALPTGWALL
jgi:Protein of unknown function (DUF402)